MRLKKLHEDLIMPIKSTKGAGAFDIYMPDGGTAQGVRPTKVALGFAAEVPQGYVALIVPRSGVGAKFGVELNNTCGVIDSDYRGQWFAALRTKDGMPYMWAAQERVLQFLIIPVLDVQLELVDELESTDRGDGGFGSSGK